MSVFIPSFDRFFLFRSLNNRGHIRQPANTWSNCLILLGSVLLALLITSCGREQAPNSPAESEGLSSTASTPKNLAIETAEIIISGGEIYTAIDAQPTVEAVAIRGSRILATGSKDEILELASPATRMIDLSGAAMYPGFTDSHAHLRAIGMRELTLNLEGSPSLAAMAAKVQSAMDGLAPGESLYGRGWIETNWPEKRVPNRADLDPFSPDNPVILERADGHAMLVNSLALKRANINADTSDPAGGRIEKDAQGEPTGILVDAAQDLVASLLDSPSPERKRQAYEVGAKIYAAYGWTGTHNMSVAPDDISLMETLAGSLDSSGINHLPIRVYNSIEPEGFEALAANGPRQDESGRIITRAVKLYADGALGSRGAALFAPYQDQESTNGLLLITAQEAKNYMTSALKAGIQVNTHAIGDRGNALVLDWYEEVTSSADQPVGDVRFRIEHAQIVRPIDIMRFQKNAVIASMQPSHAIGDLFFAPDRLGPERMEGAYAWRSMIDSGVIIAGGSDAPVERGDPRIEFYAAIARKDLKGFQGENWYPQEIVSRQEALKMFTAWPAYASFQEENLGTIEAGKKADFTVFSDDIMTIEPQDILNTKTVMTWVDGKIIYQDQ